MIIFAKNSTIYFQPIKIQTNCQCSSIDLLTATFTTAITQHPRTPFQFTRNSRTEHETKNAYDLTIMFIPLYLPLPIIPFSQAKHFTFQKDSCKRIKIKL